MRMSNVDSLNSASLQSEVPEYKIPTEESLTMQAARGALQKEVDIEMERCHEHRSSSQEKDEFNRVGDLAEGVSTGNTAFDESSKNKLRLTPVMAHLQEKITLVDDLLAKVKEREVAVKASHAALRAEVKALLEEMMELLRSYSTAGMKLLEAELKSRAEAEESRVQKVLDLHRQLKKAELQANTLLDEQDKVRFSEGILDIEMRAASLMLNPLEIEQIDAEAASTNMAGMYVEMECHNYQLRLNLGAAQRRLRAILNPSEVTFDAETLHPNLVLSEDLKTVSFTASKQPYPAGPNRFTSFLQALSSQSFSKGEHCWSVVAEGCSWVLGVCYRGLPCSGSGSGLESSTGAWCLMWCNNLLRAYEGGQDIPLMRTTSLQKVEIRLSFSNNSVAFYSISCINGAKTHLHTFSVSFTEPICLAVRMMSGQPNARITLCE